MPLPKTRIQARTVALVIGSLFVVPFLVNILSAHADPFLSRHAGAVGGALADALAWKWTLVLAGMLPGIVGVLLLYRWSLAAPAAPVKRSMRDVFLAQAPKGLTDYHFEILRSMASLRREYAGLARAQSTYLKRVPRQAARFNEAGGNASKLRLSAGFGARDMHNAASKLEKAFPKIVDETDQVMTGLKSMRIPSPEALNALIETHTLAGKAEASFTGMTASCNQLIKIGINRELIASSMRLQSAIDAISQVDQETITQSAIVLDRLRKLIPDKEEPQQ